MQSSVIYSIFINRGAADAKMKLYTLCFPGLLGLLLAAIGVAAGDQVHAGGLVRKRNYDPSLDPNPKDTIGALLIKILHSVESEKSLTKVMRALEEKAENIECAKVTYEMRQNACEVLKELRRPVRFSKTWYDCIDSRSLYKRRFDFVSSRMQRRDLANEWIKSVQPPERLEVRVIMGIHKAEINAENRRLELFIEPPHPKHQVCMHLEKLFSSVMESLCLSQSGRIEEHSAFVRDVWCEAFSIFLHRFKVGYPDPASDPSKAAQHVEKCIVDLKEALVPIYMKDYNSNGTPVDMTEEEAENHAQNVKRIRNFVEMTELSVRCNTFFIHQRYNYLFLIKKVLMVSLRTPYAATYIE
ncbi:uncharacterized protein NEMAJ01_0222 [Nematocida major]|uniref:uncharacterized protein n=1 Tax=Nematocida major TaxID=1912982 RepID=UPI00200891AE|nr:uncharacterized protein NEMAJ01_0222 [Nematocida major]KAH9385326.1 hypothetical protein NEMAJ01_0222 [Nematocida major]